MTIDANDRATPTLPGLPKPPKPRGRPAKGNALSGADRQRLYRERLRAKGAVSVTALISREVHAALESYARDKNLTINDAIESLLSDRLSRYTELENGYAYV